MKANKKKLAGNVDADASYFHAYPDATQFEYGLS